MMDASRMDASRIFQASCVFSLVTTSSYLYAEWRSLSLALLSWSFINLLVVVAVLARPERFVEGACQLKRGHLVMATLLLGFMGPVILIFDADFRLVHVLPVVCPSACLVGWAMLSWRLRYLQKEKAERNAAEASPLIQPMEPYLRDMSWGSPSTFTSENEVGYWGSTKQFLDSDETPKQDHTSISVGSLTTDVEEVPLMA